MPEVAWTLRFGAGSHLPTCLTGKSAMACPALFAKIFLFPFGANHLFILAIPAHAKGAFRDRHGRWARDAMDAAALARDGIAGRVLARERSPGAQTNGANADGEVVWS